MGKRQVDTRISSRLLLQRLEDKKAFIESCIEWGRNHPEHVLPDGQTFAQGQIVSLEWTIKIVKEMLPGNK